LIDKAFLVVNSDKQVNHALDRNPITGDPY
jgi:hypothetical protein